MVRVKLASGLAHMALWLLAVMTLSAGYAPAAFAKNVVKICAVLPTSGPAAAIGIGMMNSMDLAAKQINASGKLGDIEIELLKLDDGSQASMGMNAVLKAVSDPAVLACSAHFNSPVALATQDVFHRNGIANLVPAAIIGKLTAEQKGDEIFRIAPPDVWQISMAAKFPLAMAGKRFFLIDDSTQYGKSLVSEMEKNAVKEGGEKVGADSIAVGEKDFTAILTKAKGLNPDFIFFGGVTTEAALIRQQMVKLGIKALFYTGSGVISPTYISIAGPAGEGTYGYFYGLPYQAYPGGKKFVDDYAKGGYDKPFETYGLWAYASIEVLAEAAKRANAKGTLTRRGIIDELKTGEFPSILGEVSFPRPGDIKQRVIAYYGVKDGKWTMTHKSDENGKVIKLDTPVPLDAN